MNFIVKWMWELYIESISSIFDKKSPLFCRYWTFFWPESMIPWLLNWSISWIESPEFVLNWVIIWIEFLVCNIERIIELNHFSAKFKHWIESDRVSPTPRVTWICISSKFATIHCLKSGFRAHWGKERKGTGDYVVEESLLDKHATY